MAVLPVKKIGLTEAERGLAFAFFGIGVFGAILAFSVVNRLSGGQTIFRGFGLYDVWVIASGVAGACGGLYAARRWFGDVGAQGWIRASVGSFVTTFFGALISGTLALPFYGTMFGPFALATSFIAHPLLAIFWVTTLAAAHMMYVRYRNERDSIFAIEEDDGIPI